MRLLIINGPNLNMLGIREPELYGTATYKDLIDYVNRLCPDCEAFQSNHEGEIIDKIQSAIGKFDGIVINPAGYSHYSIAIADALRSVNIPAVEVHLTDIYQREEYRRITVTGEACLKVFAGKGFDSYREGIEYLNEI